MTKIRDVQIWVIKHFISVLGRSIWVKIVQILMHVEVTNWTCLICMAVQQIIIGKASCIWEIGLRFLWLINYWWSTLRLRWTSKTWPLSEFQLWKLPKVHKSITIPQTISTLKGTALVTSDWRLRFGGAIRSFNLSFLSSKLQSEFLIKSEWSTLWLSWTSEIWPWSKFQ